MADPPQVWLTSYYGFIPRDWGFLSFTDPGRVKTVKQETVPGFLCVIYGAKGDELPSDKVGRILGIYQCSHVTGLAKEFISPLGMQRKRRLQKSENSWNYGFQATRAWSVSDETSMHVKDFAHLSYTAAKGMSVSRFGVKLSHEEALKILNFDLVEDEVYGIVPNFLPILAPAKQAFLNGAGELSPSKAGPVSQTGHHTREAEGPKHLYVLSMDGPIKCIIDGDVSDGLIVKVGFSKSPRTRCKEINKSLPECKIKWRVMKSTHDDGLPAYPTSAHAIAGENEMKLFLDRHACSLGNEFFLADPEMIERAWDTGNRVAKDFP